MDPGILPHEARERLFRTEWGWKNVYGNGHFILSRRMFTTPLTVPWPRGGTAWARVPLALGRDVRDAFRDAVGPHDLSWLQRSFYVSLLAVLLMENKYGHRHYGAEPTIPSWRSKHPPLSKSIRDYCHRVIQNNRKRDKPS